MEFGQVLHDNPVGIDLPDFATALIVAIRTEIARVYWNVNQKHWKGAEREDVGYYDPEDVPEEGRYDPGIPGFQWREYYNWGGHPKEEDWDQQEADRPNFAFEGVEIRWYKHFGRSMNTNVCWPADKWVRWFQRAMQTIHAFGSRGPHYPGEPSPYPSPEGIVPIEPTSDDLRYVALLEQNERLRAQINCMACVCLDVADRKTPEFTPEDWRWCETLEWVTKLGIHALHAKEDFQVQTPDS